MSGKNATGLWYTANWKIDNGGDPHEVKEHSRENLDKQWLESAGLLSPHLRLYQIHSATRASGVLDNDEVVEGLARLKRQNGLRIGLTLSGVEQPETLRMALKVWHDMRVVSRSGVVQTVGEKIPPPTRPGFCYPRIEA